MASLNESTHEKCQLHLISHSETSLGNGFRGFLYCLVFLYCFIGLSAITDRFFRSMEDVVEHSRTVEEIDPRTNAKVVRQKKVWNYVVADIALLAFGTTFPQISLASIDAIRNLGNLYAGGLGPGTLVGSAASNLFPIHAVCVLVPKAGQLKKISDIGVWVVELAWSFWAYVWLYIILKIWTPNVVTLWEASLTVVQYGLLLIHAYAQDKRWPYVSLPMTRDERSDWVVPIETPPYRNDDNRTFDEHSTMHDEVDEDRNRNVVDIVSIHSSNAEQSRENKIPEKDKLPSIWKQQFIDAITLESAKSRMLNNTCLRLAKTFWQFLLAPWRLLFAFIPPHQIAHGWIAFISSLVFISGITYVVVKLTDLISCVTGINAYIMAITALSVGMSWPALIASMIATKRQITADSAIANITGSNAINIYVGIGMPWLINTLYNFLKYKEPLKIEDVGGLSFSLLVFFATSVGYIGVFVFRRLTLGAELGGPRHWAWVTSVYLMMLWFIFVILSSLRVSGII